MFQGLQILTFFHKATSSRASLLGAHGFSSGNLATLDIGASIKENPMVMSDNTIEAYSLASSNSTSFSRPLIASLSKI
jgi:hypothetical protein